MRDESIERRDIRSIQVIKLKPIESLKREQLIQTAQNQTTVIKKMSENNEEDI